MAKWPDPAAVGATLAARDTGSEAWMKTLEKLRRLMRLSKSTFVSQAPHGVVLAGGRI